MGDIFKKYSAFLVKTMENEAGVSLTYDEASIAWLQDYIERERRGLDAAAVESLTSVIGSFLGECTRLQFGGEWVESKYGWGVCFGWQNCVFPFNKVRKQFASGIEESILSYYRSIPIVFKPAES